MSRRHYINNAAVVETSGALTSGATSVTVSDASSFPVSFPWTAVIDAGTASAEVVLVTAAATNTLTIERGYDGTAAQSHAANAAFSHEAVKADYDEANDHINATAAHGVAGDVVGTTDTQTLTNKTITAPDISDPTITGDATAEAATFTGDVIIDHSGSANQALTIKPHSAQPSLVLETSSGGIVVLVEDTGDTTFSADVTVEGDTTLAGVTADSATVAGVTGGLVPTASVLPFAGSAAPTGWLICDGSAVSRTTYATLYAAVGDAFGDGDGTTTFNVPDLRDNVPVGKSGTKALASTGGAATHNHGLTGAHALITLTAGGSFIQRSAATSWAANQTVDGSPSANSDSFTTAAALQGNTSTESNLPPYVALNFIIKA